jgi:hypothetical protein
MEDPIEQYLKFSPHPSRIVVSKIVGESHGDKTTGLSDPVTIHNDRILRLRSLTACPA